MKRQYLRNAPATRLQTKLSILSIVTGVALMAVIVSISVFLYLNVGTGQATQAGTNKPLPTTSKSDSTGRGVPSDGVSIESAQSLSFSLLNSSGDILMQQAVMAGNGALEVNLPQLPAGLYVMSVKGMKAQTQKFTVKLAVDQPRSTGG